MIEFFLSLFDAQPEHLVAFMDLCIRGVLSGEKYFSEEENKMIFSVLDLWRSTFRVF